MDRDDRHLGASRTEEVSQAGDIGQFTGVEEIGEPLGKLALATTVMGQRQQLDHGLAGLPVGELIEETIKGVPIFLPGEEIIAIGEMERQRRNQIRAL